jgi:hypothetical protein
MPKVTKCLSKYVREANKAIEKGHRKNLRELKRTAAMKMIGRTKHRKLFQSIEGEDFENQ